MRKIFCALLCLTLLLGCGREETADKVYPSGVSHKEYLEKYGEAIDAVKEQDGESFIDAFLLDVDNDKEPELVELVKNDEGIGSVVYAYYDSLMVRMDEFQDCVFDYGERKGTAWTGKDGLQYFYKTIAAGDEAMNELYYFDGGIRREIVHTCETYVSESYIDGDETDKEEYGLHIKKCPENTGLLKKQTLDIGKNNDKGKNPEKYWKADLS